MTRRLTVVAWILVGAFSAAGCDWIWGARIKPGYCDKHPEDSDCPDAGDTGRCTSSATCVAPTSVCDVAGTMTCVQCVAPSDVSACTNTTPTCGADHACHACSKHDDCPASSACLPDGSCALATQVAYVDPVAGSGSQCTQATPCKKVSDALNTTRPYVKLTGTVDEAVTINNQNVTILASPGAKLTRTNPGVILKVDGTSVVEIVDLAVSDGLGGTGIGISMPPGNAAALTLLRTTVTNNTGGGISASGGRLTLSQSTVSLNTAGGIAISGAQFDITNTFIVKNGGVASSFGGVKLDSIGAGTRRLDFNTIADNQGMDGLALGVFCVPGSQPMVFSNNIVYENQIGGTRTQVSGPNCSWTYSDIGDTVSGVGNLNADPMFVNPNLGNFHIKATSPARDAADPAATLAVDFEGEARPQGPHSDMGADEFKP